MAKRTGKEPKLLPAGRPKTDGRLMLDSMAEALAAAIEAGGAKPGDLLPPERTLAARHRIGRITVRSALRKLVAEGVLECCPRVGYRVVSFRRETARGRPVGLIRQDVSNNGRAPSRSIGVIENLLARSGRGLLICSSRLDGTQESDCIRRCRGAGAAGLIVTPATGGVASLELAAWIRAKLPVVLEGHPGRWLLPDDLAERCDQVDIDNRGAILKAVEYLRGQGHVRLSFFTSGQRQGSERATAFEEALGVGGCSGQEWILTGLADGRSGGEEALMQMLAAPEGERPTAAICSGSDEIALGLIAAARTAGLRCPGDLSVISFGDNRLVEDPAGLAELSALEFKQEDMAGTLVGLLLEQMAGARRAPRRERLPVELVVRASCGRPEPTVMAGGVGAGSQG
ncbi:MAG TPA: GntR family transcriptional regulator [Planctomycetota bacterium]|nr:GntR family transcriptional regulator [Planctomycetota bacterium]